jgi:hypothetical protein
LYGIPYNRQIYDQQLNVALPNYNWTFADKGVPISGAPPSATITGNALHEPAVFITQRERYWPMPSKAVGVTPTPKYVWDCMFRRFNGRILVGMFVYRVLPANGLLGGTFIDPITGNTGPSTPYVSAKATDITIANYPPIPQWVSSRQYSPKNLKLDQGFSRGLWGAGGLDANVGNTKWSGYFSPNRDDCGVPGTGPINTQSNPKDATASDPSALTYSETWQQPGQWMIDQYNNVHHVIEGRRTLDDGPVILAKPVPRQPYSNALFDSGNRSLISRSQSEALLATPDSGGDALQGIQDLWFVPTYDANNNQIIPVFACVEEL